MKIVIQCASGKMECAGYWRVCCNVSRIFAVISGETAANRQAGASNETGFRTDEISATPLP